MPELPEVETVVRGLRPVLEGQRLAAVVARRPDLRWPLPADLGQRLTGATVTRLHRRAKYALLDSDRGDTLILHLGMSGKVRPLDGEPGVHDHVIIRTERTALAYHDPRRFGSMHLVPTVALGLHPLLAGLGPEPLSDEFSGAVLAARAKGRNIALKALILDQKLVAGIGNIYACEALFRAGLHPEAKAGEVAPMRFHRLADAIRAVLAEAIAAGGSTLRDHAQVSGELGYFQHRFQVYGQAGRPCPRCGTPIRRIIQSGRSSFCCPACQQIGGQS